MFCKKGVLRNFAKFTGTPVPESLFNKAAGLGMRKETLAQVFPFKLFKISENAFSYRTPPVAVSE